MEAFDSFIILVLIGIILYLFFSNRKDNFRFVQLLEQEHQRALAAIATIAETSIETVKATTLTEREQVRAQRQVNDVQVGQMRDIIEKQAKLIVKKAPEKVRLEDGTEVAADEYDWGIGV